jgi:hypothetical protein
VNHLPDVRRMIESFTVDETGPIIQEDIEDIEERSTDEEQEEPDDTFVGSADNDEEEEDDD